MKILIAKMSNLKLLKFELILGALVMLAAFIMIPLSIFSIDIELMKNIVVWAFVLGLMLIVALIGIFGFIRPYFAYKKLPEIQAETDGEFLYIHTKKEAKIPLASLANATVTFDLPFMYQRVFLRQIIIHFFSDEYGSVVLEVPEYGTFKMPYVAHVKEAAQDLAYFVDEVTANSNN